MIVASIPITFKSGRAADLLGHMTETGREYEFVPDITLPEGCSAAIEIVKPDGMFVIAECSIVEGNIIVALPDQALVVRGLAHYIIRITTADNKIIFSAAGSIWVDDALITNEMLESISEVYGLVFPDDFLTEADLTDYAKKSEVPQIEANPAGAADYDLNKLKLNNVIYKIPDPAVTKTASGNPIEISDGAAAPLIKCVTQITGYQEGSGTPSPDNIRPIVAYTEGKIEVSDGDGNVTTHSTTYPSAIYRGSEDCVKGEVSYDMKMLDLSNITFSIITGIPMIYGNVPDAKPYTNSQIAGCVCNKYETVSRDTIGYGDIYRSGVAFSNNHICIADTTKSWSTVADALADLSDIQIAYELATPTTSTVTPTNLPIKSLNGYSHLESSTGEMAIEYITEKYQPIVDLIQSSGGDSQHHYSTDEQVVGTWIDGSDIFEKTIEVTQSLTAGGDNLIAINVNNFGKLINVHGSATCAGIPNLPIPMMSSSLISYIINPYSVDANGYLHLEVGTIYTGNNILQDVIITLQYTKTSN